MANTTPNLNLSVTPESTNKSFKAWRLEMDNDTNSNMTKIDDAFGNLNTTKFPVAGGTLTGKVTIKTEDTVTPSLTLYSPEKPNEGRAFASILKNANNDTDGGLMIFDYVRGGNAPSTAAQHLRLILKASATAEKDLMTLYFYPETGTAKTYHLYGEHNQPTTADVEGLDTHYAKISSRTMIRSGEDLNTYVTAGCYQSYSTAEARQILNTPEANASTHLNAGIVSFKLDVEYWGGATYSQTLTTISAVQYMRYTNNTGSSWGAWVKMTP